MTDEEKEAIKNIKKEFEKNHILPDIANEDLGILLNLIEKQSKEIEELKAISEYREKIIKGLGLKTLPKTITGFKKMIENNDKKWGDKIKSKIEELDIEIQCCEYADDDLEEYKQDIEKEKARLLRDKAILQSLLEKE